MRSGTALIALLTIGTLAGCGGRVSNTAGNVASAAATAVNPATYVRVVAQTTGQVVNTVANTTSKTVNRGGGSQVEYLAADGDAYRVLPGSDQVQAGQWGTRETPGRGSGTQICSRYPAPGQPDIWDCIDTVRWLTDHDELRDGDPLKLEEAKRVPEPLPSTADFTLAQEAELWGRNATLAPNKATWATAP